MLPGQILPLLAVDIFLLLEDSLQLVDLPAGERGSLLLQPPGVLRQNVCYEVPGELSASSSSPFKLEIEHLVLPLSHHLPAFKSQ